LPWIIPSEAVGPSTPRAELRPDPVILELDGTAPPSTRDGSQAYPLILVAEDNENLIEIYSDYLQTNSYRVVVARDGLETLAVARKNEPNLMLIDVQMPKMSGLEVMRQLRTEERFADVPIIALTAHVMPADKERCLNAGANDFLGKPSSMNQIMAMIEKYLQKSS
jgi:CheY-like chemotaxis protein